MHVALVWFQKHTQFPGPGRTENNVVGVRILPTFAAKGGGFFAVSVGAIAIMSGLFQINPIWNLGPIQPDAGVRRVAARLVHGFLDGTARLWPAWEMNLFGNYTIPAIFFPAVIGMAHPDRRCWRPTR